MVKRISSVIFSLIIIASVNLVSFAYSTDQYDIEIPDSLVQNSDSEEQNNNSTFISNENENCGISIVCTEDMLDFSLSEKNLDFFKKNIESQYESSNITNKITTFTKNNYKCFYYDVECTFGDNTAYMQTYITRANDNCYYINIFSDNKEFLDSESIKNAVNSFTIKNYTPASDNTLQNPPLTSIINLGTNHSQPIGTFFPWLGGIVASKFISNIIAIVIALIIVKKNNRRVASYEDESNSRQLENEQDS